MGIAEWFSSAKFSKTPSTYKFSPRAKVITLWLFAGVGALFVALSTHFLAVFIWAAVAAYLLNPIVSYFSSKTKTSKVFSIALLYLVVGVLIYLAAKTLFPVISNEISDLSSGSIDQSTSFIGRVASHGNFSFFDITINLKDFINNIIYWISSQVQSHAFPIFFGVIERIVFILIFFVATFYFLFDADKYEKYLERVIPAPYCEEMLHLFEKINSTLGAYIRAQVVLILIMSIASFTVLSVLRVQYSIVLSLATGILEVIPIAGPICATAIVATVALFQGTAPYGLSNTVLALLVIISYFILRQAEDYLVIPNVASKFVKVHPLLGIFALLLGGSIGGILGLFLAIPAAAVAKVILSYLYEKITE